MKRGYGLRGCAVPVRCTACRGCLPPTDLHPNEYVRARLLPGHIGLAYLATSIPLSTYRLTFPGFGCFAANLIEDSLKCLALVSCIIPHEDAKCKPTRSDTIAPERSDSRSHLAVEPLHLQSEPWT